MAVTYNHDNGNASYPRLVVSGTGTSTTALSWLSHTIMMMVMPATGTYSTALVVTYNHDDGNASYPRLFMSGTGTYSTA